MDEIRKDKANYVINISLISNFFLAIVKSIIGVTAHSSALLADGINSTSDVVYLIFVKIYMKFADKPADREHPYGHAQLESIASIIVGAFVLTTAVAIFWDAINKVYDYFAGNGGNSETTLFALVVALMTIIIKIVLSWYSAGVAKKYNSSAVLAVSKDHKNDIMSAAAAAVGIIFNLVGYSWIDPLAGAFVALFILKTGIQIIRDSADELMSTNPDSSQYQEIKEIVMQIEGVKNTGEMYIHYFGPYIMVNLTICVDENISVKEGNRIADEVEKNLYEKIKYVKKVNVHYHPQSSNK